jgi:hypothetical protein
VARRTFGQYLRFNAEEAKVAHVLRNNPNNLVGMAWYIDGLVAPAVIIIGRALGVTLREFYSKRENVSKPRTALTFREVRSTLSMGYSKLKG